MTNMKVVGFAVAVTLAAMGCDPLVLGNGAVVEEVRTVPEFTDGLRVENALKVRYHVGPQSVTVRADSNVIGLIETFVENGVLVVRRVDGVEFLAATNELDVWGPALPQLEANSAATLEVTFPPVDALKLSANSSSTVTAKGLQARRLELVADSASTALVTGELSELQVTGVSSSTVDTRGATAQRATVNATSSSWLKVRASDEVTGTAQSSSRVDIYGRPRVTNVVATSASTVAQAE